MPPFAIQCCLHPPATSNPRPSCKSFELIDHARYASRRVTVPLRIFGENTVAYHAVKKLTMIACPLKRDAKCTGRAAAPGAGMQEVVVPLGERVLIAGVRATDGQLMNHLRSYVCDKDRFPAITVKDGYILYWNPLKAAKNNLDKIYLEGLPTACLIQARPQDRGTRSLLNLLDQGLPCSSQNSKRWKKGGGIVRKMDITSNRTLIFLLHFQRLSRFFF